MTAGLSDQQVIRLTRAVVLVQGRRHEIDDDDAEILAACGRRFHDFGREMEISAVEQGALDRIIAAHSAGGGGAP